MNLSILVAHPVKIGKRNRDRFGTNAEKTANINYDQVTSVDMVHRSDLVIVSTVDGC